jgi:hypothetical protein
VPKFVTLFKSGPAEPARRGLRLGAALVLVASLMATGLGTTTPAAAAGGTAPADLLNLAGLTETATPAQIVSLKDLEQQAVSNTLTDHGLPESDFDAAQTWGRDTAEGELWALLVQAVNTPADQQTTDQANAVAWLSNLALQQNVQAADDAGLEYAKWAGLGASAYQSLLTTDPSEAEIQSFLSGTPLNYGPGDGPSTPESTSDEGFCLYDPPAGGTTYTNSIFTTRDCTPRRPALHPVPASWAARRPLPPRASSSAGGRLTPTSSHSTTRTGHRSTTTSRSCWVTRPHPGPRGLVSLAWPPRRP